MVADVVDVLQTPAFLARQTDFIAAVAASGKPVNIKKAQFLAPGDMVHVVAKARAAAEAAGVPADNFMVCERGASFGYNNLVSDMRSLAIMRDTRHARSCSTRPTRCSCRAARAIVRAASASSSLLARAAVAAGISGLFHRRRIPIPIRRYRTGRTAGRSTMLEALLERLIAIDCGGEGTSGLD